MDRIRATVVWIDSEQAIVCRWSGEGATVDRIESEVPAHHRATGHVRHAPDIPHSGGRAQDGGEPHRLEHLRGFLAQVARVLPPNDLLEVVGPGTVHERLVSLVSDDDRVAGRSRQVRSAHADVMTERQLVARARELADSPAPRRVAGIH